MADVRLLIQEEGRTARNLVAFNVPLGVNTSDRVTRKPPSVPRISSSASLKRNIKNSARVRSASTGRDKKSELQARYWAFLFGNLQRAVDGIYQTCEEDENISECKEVIMVLENYTRDFHNLIEWFKVKWAYENSPPPLRTAPLAWEVRKTSPCRLWNSSSIPSKCSSPNQRLSPPFCKSPEEQLHECKKYLHDITDYKKLNDYKNNITKKDPKKKNSLYKKESERLSIREKTILSKAPVKLSSKPSIGLNRKLSSELLLNKDGKNTSINKENKQMINKSTGNLNQSEKEKTSQLSQNKIQIKNTSKNDLSSNRKCYSSTVARSSTQEMPKIYRSKTTLTPREIRSVNKVRPGSSVMIRRRVDELKTENLNKENNNEIRGSVEVLSKQSDVKSRRQSEDSDGWQTVRSRYRRGSSHSLNMATRFHRPTTATSLPALSIDTKVENNIPKINDNNLIDKHCDNNIEDNNIVELKNVNLSQNINCETNSTSMIAAVFKSEADLLEKRIQQFMSAQAERERIILEEERKTEEADSKRSKQLSDEEEFLQKQIQELESTEIDIDTETDETDGEMVLEIEDDNETVDNESGMINVIDDISLEDRYENMLEGMSWTERMDTLAQLQALVARHPGRALELHQKLSSPSRKRSLPETLRRYQAKQACAQHKRQKLLSEKSQRLRELLNKVEDVKRAKNQLTEDKRLRMEMKLKRAEENRTQHLLEVVRKAHDEESKLKEIAFINELEAQNKKHDFYLLCQEQTERLQGIQEERQRRQEEKAAKEAAAEERRRAIEAERQLRIQKMRQARQEREERVGKMQLEREKERQELAREKARDREERLSALHAAQLATCAELQKKIAQKQQESARRHVENIEHIRQRAVELSILRIEENPPTLKFYIAPKQCSLCSVQIPNEVCLLSHLKGKIHFEAVKKMHDGREPSRDELQRFNIAQIRDMQIGIDKADDKVAKEKQKALKRRCRKLKQRLTARGQEWKNPCGDKTENFESPNKAKFRRNLKELDRLCGCHGKTPWSSVAVSGLERYLGEIGRAFSKAGTMDQDAFRSLSGFESLTNLLNLGVNIQNNSHNLPNKSIVTICRVYRAAVADHSDNIESILLSNKILVILDLLLQRFETVAGLEYQAQAVETTGNSHAGNGSGSVTTAVIQLLCSLVSEVPSTKTSIQNRIHDIIGFLVTGGLIDRITRHNHALIETDFFHDHDHESQMLLASYDLLSRFCCNWKKINGDNGGGMVGNNDNEQTMMESHLFGCLQMTEAAGTIGCLYSTFALAQQKSSSPTPGQNSCSSFMKILAFKTLRLLRNIGQADLQVLQNLLGNEGTNLQWRLIANHMMTRFLREPIGDLNDSTLSTQNSVTILLELISVLGYFAVNNIENQLILQTAGTGPSVLQHLCTLPFPFYGDPKLAPFTLPTLLAATHKNSEAISILSCEMSYQLLEEYRNSEEGKNHPLIRLLKDT